MKHIRINRLNSLLKEVISEVITKEISNPNISEFISITKVEITQDLHTAKVYISIIGNTEEKKKTMNALESASGFISVQASKKVVLRYFPSLTFKLDTSVDEHMKIEKILQNIKQKEISRTLNHE